MLDTSLATREQLAAQQAENLPADEKARLDRLGMRQAKRLDVTSDEHQYVWGFRQDRPDEVHALHLADIAASTGEWAAKTAAAGHAMTWELNDRGAGQGADCQGRCGNCGATMSIFASGTSIGRGAWCARDMPCKGPGTAWQEELVRDLRNQRCADAVAQFGQDVKDEYDKAWLAGQGIER